MVVKIYVSGISGNKEVKKRQQRVLMILDSKNIKYEVIDITEPGRETDKDFMQNNAKSNGGTVSDPNPRSPLPPQIFNDEEYCGDYDQFDMANEVDTLEQFLKVEAPPEEPPQAENELQKSVNGDVNGEEGKVSKEASQEKEIVETENKEAEVNEASPAKEGSPAKPSREATPVEDGKSKETTPANDEVKEQPADEPAKEKSPERQTSIDKEATPEKAESPVKETELEPEKLSEENTINKEEAVNENGTVSSRDHSEEKDVDAEIVERKKDPSEALIQSEQATQ